VNPPAVQIKPGGLVLESRGWKLLDSAEAGSAWPNFSPQSPRALHSTGLRLGSFEDLQPDAVIQFHPRGVENRADGSGHTAFPANDFTEIARRNLQLQNCNVLAFYYSDGDRFRDVNESFSDIFDQLFHAPASFTAHSFWWF
jgi:hypothetical protein